MNMQHMTLNSAEQAYRNGIMSEAEVTQFIRVWNAGPHFTQAIFRDGAIRNYDPEKTRFSKHEIETFGIKGV